MRTTPATPTVALAARRLLPAAALALLVGLLILGGEHSPARAGHGSTPGQVDFVSIDMDTTGNTATSLGSRQECVSVPLANSFNIDVTVDEIDAIDGIAGFNFDLLYDPAIVKVTAKDFVWMLFAGGGIRGGQVIGKTDKTGSEPVGDAYAPDDAAASFYRALGIDHRKEYHTPDGRPVMIVGKGSPIPELWG